jgi:hypothetical protein
MQCDCPAIALPVYRHPAISPVATKGEASIKARNFRDCRARGWSQFSLRPYKQAIFALQKLPPEIARAGRDFLKRPYKQAVG